MNVSFRRHSVSGVRFVALALLGVPGPAAGVTPQIASTKPAAMLVNAPPRELNLHGSGLVPAGATFDQLPARVKPLMRVGASGDFQPAKLLVPGSEGWGPSGIAVQVPGALTGTPGTLQIKVVVDGVSSNVHAMPILPDPPPVPPHVTNVSPSQTVFGSNPYYYVLRVTGTGVSRPTHPRPRFQGVDIPGGAYVTDFLGGWVQFSVPQQYRSMPGRYSVQLANDLGTSEAVPWDLVIKPELKEMSPSHISPAWLQRGAPPVKLTITFGTSRPETVRMRVDEGAWTPVVPQSIGLHTLDLTVAFVALHPAKTVSFKLLNAAGESSVGVLHVLVPIEQRTPNPKAPH